MQKYFLESTGNKTDVTDKIEELLEKYGVCLLGAGDYYVSGIKMPSGSSLIGVWNATRVILAPEADCGAAYEGRRRGQAVILPFLSDNKNTEVLFFSTSVFLSREHEI
jgi:hypothetical protein